MTGAYLAALYGDPSESRLDRVHMVATWLLLRQGGPEASELMSWFEPGNWQGRRVYLQLTSAWDAAVLLLEESTGVTDASN
jgi:hypothetical protein